MDRWAQILGIQEMTQYKKHLKQLHKDFSKQ